MINVFSPHAESITPSYPVGALMKGQFLDSGHVASGQDVTLVFTNVSALAAAVHSANKEGVLAWFAPATGKNVPQAFVSVHGIHIHSGKDDEEATYDLTAWDVAPEFSSVTEVWTLTLTMLNDQIAASIVGDVHNTPRTATVHPIAPVFSLPLHVFAGKPMHPLSGLNDIVINSAIGLEDIVAPVMTAFTIPATGTSYTVDVSSITASGTPSHFKITETDVAPAHDAAGWVAAPGPATYTIEVGNQAGSGDYTLYAWAKDANNNVSTASISDTIALTIS